jgi:hypothetical protein
VTAAGLWLAAAPSQAAPPCLRIAHPDEHLLVYGDERVRVQLDDRLPDEARVVVEVSYLGQRIPVTRTGDRSFSYRSFRDLDAHTVTATVTYLDENETYQTCSRQVTTSSARPPDATCFDHVVSFAVEERVLQELLDANGRLVTGRVEATIDGEPVELLDLYRTDQRSIGHTFFVFYDVSRSVTTRFWDYEDELIEALDWIRRERDGLALAHGTDPTFRFVPFTDRFLSSPHRDQGIDDASELVGELFEHSEIGEGSPVCRMIKKGMNVAQLHEEMNRRQQASAIFISDFFDQDSLYSGRVNLRACADLRRQVASYTLPMHGIQVDNRSVVANRAVVKQSGGFLEGDISRGIARILRSHNLEASIAGTERGGEVELASRSADGTTHQLYRERLYPQLTEDLSPDVVEALMDHVTARSAEGRRHEMSLGEDVEARFAGMMRQAAAEHLLYCPMRARQPSARSRCHRNAAWFAEEVLPRARTLLGDHEVWPQIQGIVGTYCSDDFPGTAATRERLASFLQ